MSTMHHRTRFITSLLTLSSATLVVGCSEHSDQPDQIATISADFAETLRSRPAVRENSSTPDDSASTLRKLAGQARSSDAAGSDLLANRIYTSAGTFDLDEAMRLESMAARLRNLARKLAANADLLADAASSAENLDISDANRMIETWRAEASSELNGAEEKLQEILQPPKRPCGDARVDAEGLAVAAVVHQQLGAGSGVAALPSPPQ